MTRVAILAAFPAELKPLVRGWPHSIRAGIHFWARRNEEEEWIAACAGAGQPAVTRAFAALEDGGPIDLVFSIGWAGALRENLPAGSAYNVAGVIDIRTGERFRCDAESGSLWLVTSPRVADENEKLRLASTYKAALVDMEAAAIARLAAMRGIPFYAIKGISDSLHAKLPDFNQFIAPDGRMQTAKLIFHVLPRPWHWPALIQMGENSKKAARNIAETLHSFLAEQDNSEVT
jgi:adenosylhomocysteine nucleosidase